MGIDHLITVFIWLMSFLFGISCTTIEKNEEMTNSSITLYDGIFEITCEELKSITVIGRIFVSTSPKEKNEVWVNFYLSTKKHRTQTKVGPETCTALRSSGFDPSLKTVIIIHGYRSSGMNPWVLEMKEKLLDSKLRAEINICSRATGEIQWNHLYFIGHSLGAQISGQTAHLLKGDKFWKVKRITGLDPAKPCFMNVDRSLRVDKDDADFVDIIHTQIGTGGSVDALGLTESIGHMDFYVNTGILQPACIGSFFNPRWNTMICSHRFAYRYFTESIVNSKSDACQCKGYPWNGTYVAAEHIISRTLKGEHTGIYMGINAPKSAQMGRFLVLTGPNEPYCKDLRLHLEKSRYLEKLLNVIKRLKGLVSIFNPTRIINPNPTEILYISFER